MTAVQQSQWIKAANLLSVFFLTLCIPSPHSISGSPDHRGLVCQCSLTEELSADRSGHEWPSLNVMFSRASRVPIDCFKTTVFLHSYLTYTHDLILLCITNVTHCMPILHTKYFGLFNFVTYYLFANVSFLNNNGDAEHHLLDREWYAEQWDKWPGS